MASFPHANDMYLSDLDAPRLELTDLTSPECLLMRLRSQNRALEHLRRALDVESEFVVPAARIVAVDRLDRVC